jgi:hypothetical protein
MFLFWFFLIQFKKQDSYLHPAWMEKESFQYIQMDFKVIQVYLILPIHHAIYEFFSHSNKNEFTHTEDTMMYQKVNSYTPWDS